MNLSVNNITPITRFSTEIGKTARRLNQLAIRDLKSEKIEYTFPKATVEDLKRLTSKKIEDTYKRVTWTNPKDGKVYHILEEGRSKEGVNVRILSSEGEFIKNATLKPKTIVVFDQFKNLRGIRSMLKLQFRKYAAHGEIVETFLKRANPFANIERLNHKKNLYELIKYRGDLPQSLVDKRFAELNKSMGKGHKVDYISMTESNSCDIGELSKQSGDIQKKTIQEELLNKEFKPITKTIKSILKKGCRFFATASNENNPKQSVNVFLAIDGVEGVGSLARNGKIAADSASRNSIFTQHYERRSFKGHLVEENGKVLGINITGQSGAELPYKKKYEYLLRGIGGTSYSTPTRVGKISLNDMMEGILP